MFYFHYMPYETGDEHINVDSLNNAWLGSLFTGVDVADAATRDIRAWPNPFRETLSMSYTLEEPAMVSVYIYDLHGRLVKELFRGRQQAGQHQLQWDGTGDRETRAMPGIYFYSMNIEGQYYSGKVVME